MRDKISNQPLHADPAEDLEGFKAALVAQHRERHALLKRAVDEDLADMITARRLEVEKIVHNLHRTCKARLEEGLAANRSRAELRFREYKGQLRDNFLKRLEDAICSQVEAFRRTEEYGCAMKALALEAQENLSSPAIALVERGDISFLKPYGSIREVREELEGVWGGLVLVEAEKGRGRIVDNTFRTRWRRLYPSLVRDIHARMEEALGILSGS